MDLGYKSYVITDATAPISLPAGDAGTTVDVAKAEWKAKGVKEVTVAEVLKMTCPAPNPMETVGNCQKSGIKRGCG